MNKYWSTERERERERERETEEVVCLQEAAKNEWWREIEIMPGKKVECWRGRVGSQGDKTES